MKKLAVLVAVVSIAALAAPALAATNPFMDVPMNHWAYDAIGQLAAHGILSGYPDGLYKGKQQTTRYEMASALARALAVVDMTKASKQDVEMLKRLVVEFKDELEALGVRVDELDERVALLEDRLGGWKISGTLALDVTYRKKNEPTDLDPSNEGDTKFDYDEAKLIFDRWWGEDDEYHFQARLRADNTVSDGELIRADRFFVEMPFFFDTRFTVGRFSWNWEADYKVDSNIGNVETGGWTGDTLITDWRWDGLGLTKNFGIGTAQVAVAHPNSLMQNQAWSDWAILARVSLQFNEQFGLDLGGVGMIGDNAEEKGAAASDTIDTTNNNYVRRTAATTDYTTGNRAFDKMWTFYAGLRFNLNDNIALRGIFYGQKFDTDYLNGTTWESRGYGIRKGNDWVDDAKHWAVMADIKQEALKFTSLWLEYGQYDEGFFARSSKSIDYSGTLFGNAADADTKYWRVALGQEWNEKWATHIFYYGYNVENARRDGRDWKPAEMGLGVQYKLNDSTTMGLNYMRVKDRTNAVDADDDDIIRFRTLVTF